MARTWNRLSAAFVSRKDHERGRYADGGGLYLQVSKSGTPAFTFHWQRNGTVRTMGLGSARSVSLAGARELAAQAREQLAHGIDPIDARKAAALEQRAARAKLTTFKQCAEQFHSDNAPRWGNAKHRAEWISTLRRFAFPVIGHLSVAAIDSTLVHKVLAPLVAPKPVTASRVRGRIEMVLDYAKAAGLRSGDNPADKDVIAHMLPLKPEKTNVVHQPALPFAKLPGLMKALRGTEGTAARLLELIILTGMRFNAVHAARFEEFDLDTGSLDHPGGPHEGAGPRSPRPGRLARRRDPARPARRDQRWSPVRRYRQERARQGARQGAEGHRPHRARGAARISDRR